MTATLVLTIVKGAGEGAVLRVMRPRRLIVGRGEDADWRINDRFVSRRHILLEISPPSCRLLDIGFDGSGSLNAPRLNGRPVRCCVLKPGDVVELGLTQVLVSVEVLGEGCVHGADGAAEMPDPGPDPDGAPRSIHGAAEDVRCQSCGAQLTREANSDGRAAQLHGCVSYLCARCLPAGDGFAGQTVGPYELRRLLGEGGMGAVYLAYHRATARLVALKRITDVEDSGSVRRFAREVRLLGLLTHPRVVRFIESGVDQTGNPFVVTQYMPDGNLECYLQREARPAAQTAVALVCQLLEGLKYLHAWPVIHRDVKPENILLRSSSPGIAPSVVITDFGISRYYEQAGGTRLTKPGARMGTLMFMPPEQVHDAGDAGEPADTYAAGVTLYYLLTGCYTFQFPTPTQIRAFQEQAAAFRSPHQAVRDIMRMERVRHPFRIILEDEPIPVLARAPHLSGRLAAVVDKSVRKDAGQRFQTAGEFLAELSAALR